MFFWNSLAFSMIHWMLAIWSLVPLPFLNPSWTSGIYQFTYFWSLAWLILSITLLVCPAATKSLQSCPTLCDPIDGSPPGSPVPGILQARTLEWVAISFSNAWKWKVKVKLLSRVQLLATPWTAAHQAPLSMRFSRQEYWSGVPLLLLDNNIREHQDDLGYDNDFLDTTPKIWSIKKNNWQAGLH